MFTGIATQLRYVAIELPLTYRVHRGAARSGMRCRYDLHFLDIPIGADARLEERPCPELRRSPRWRGSAAARRSSFCGGRMLPPTGVPSRFAAPSHFGAARAGAAFPRWCSLPLSGRLALALMLIVSLSEPTSSLKSCCRLGPATVSFPLNAANPGSVASSA